MRILKKPLKCAMYTKTVGKDRQKIQRDRISEKRDLRNKKRIKRYRIYCLYIEETHLAYKPNVQNCLSQIGNYRQNGYFLEKNCKKVLQNAQMCYILKLRKRLSYKTGRTE